MFATVTVAAFFRTLQRPLIAIFALALVVNAWSFASAGCRYDAGCASSSPASNLEDYSLALVGALESAEDAKVDLDTTENTLVNVALSLQPVSLWFSHSAQVAVDADSSRHHVLPEKTGPPSSLLI